MIISVGEIVWDCFPGKKILGGAPVNVGYHLSCLGHDVLVVSRVGDDNLGHSTLQQLHELNVDTKGIQVDSVLATGKVNVSFDKNNEPHYDIVAPAAWDAIESRPVFDVIPDTNYSVVFGTLAQRDSRSRSAIQDLLDRSSYSFYDVNLRPPFTTKELVLDSLAKADMVKVNENELQTMGEWCQCVAKDKKETARALINAFDLDALIVTEGSDGAWILVGGQYFHAPSEPVEVADTVGAGDAFFASLIHGKTQKKPWDECLVDANQRGGFVASKTGATPKMP